MFEQTDAEVLYHDHAGRIDYLNLFPVRIPLPSIGSAGGRLAAARARRARLRALGGLALLLVVVAWLLSGRLLGHLANLAGKVRPVSGGSAAR